MYLLIIYINDIILLRNLLMPLINNINIQFEEKIVDINFFKEYYNMRKFYGENDKIYFNNIVKNILDKFDINLSEGEFKNLESKTIKSLLYKIAVYNELFELGYNTDKTKTSDNINKTNNNSTGK